MGKSEVSTIPWEEVMNGFDSGKERGPVNGLSGRRLIYHVNAGPLVLLSITDEEQDHLMLRATGNIEKDVFYLRLHTKGFNGDPNLRHPDMFAGRFIDTALSFFGEKIGFSPSYFEGGWGRGSDNHKMFYETYNRTHDLVLAARSTWSGNTMNRFGFSEIGRGDIKINQYKITAVFHRRK